MNPRLQVEHGITEALTGLDLVELQIRIARGETLGRARRGEQRGCAIEARVCAEDPDAGFLPAPGRIARFDPALGPARARRHAASSPAAPCRAAFDSLIAKVIAIGATREEARARLALRARATSTCVIEGGATNKGYLLERARRAATSARGGVDTAGSTAAARARPRHDGATPSRRSCAAAILAYQRARAQARAATSSPTRRTLTPSARARLEGQRDRPRPTAARRTASQVFAVGSWRYRVHLDGRVVRRDAARGGPRTRRASASASRTLPRALRPRPRPACASRSRAARTASAGRPPARCARARRRWWSRST